MAQLAGVLFTDPAKAGCAQCPADALLVEHSHAAAVVNAAQIDIAIALQGAVVAILYRRWRDSTPSQRRGLAPGLTVGSLKSGVSPGISDGLTLALFGRSRAFRLRFWPAWCDSASAKPRRSARSSDALMAAAVELSSR